MWVAAFTITAFDQTVAFLAYISARTDSPQGSSSEKLAQRRAELMQSPRPFWDKQSAFALF
eukprot:2198481-Pleurochrysis_carterae.AAC.3